MIWLLLDDGSTEPVNYPQPYPNIIVWKGHDYQKMGPYHSGRTYYCHDLRCQCLNRQSA